MRARLDATAPLRTIVAVNKGRDRGHGMGRLSSILELECGHRALWRKHLHSDSPPKRAKCETCLMIAKGLLHPLDIPTERNCPWCGKGPVPNGTATLNGVRGRWHPKCFKAQQSAIKQ